jgi:hypothetical protein
MSTDEDKAVTADYWVSQGGGWDDETPRPREREERYESSRVVETKADWSQFTRRTAEKLGLNLYE